MKVFYFTGTGNSLSIAKKFNCELISIPQIINNKNLSYVDDVIGLVFPVYCSYIPRIVREFLTKARISGKYMFTIITYGNKMYGDGSVCLELYKYARKRNAYFNYINSIVMVDNFIDIFDIDKEIENINNKNIDTNINNIINDISNRKEYIKKSNFIGSIITTICQPLVSMQDKGNTCKKFNIDNNCIKCGTCSKVCPRGNIEITDKVNFHDNCEGCYSCIHNCPMKAIHVKLEKNSTRYRNKDVTLEDIITSNKQEKINYENKEEIS